MTSPIFKVSASLLAETVCFVQRGSELYTCLSTNKAQMELIGDRLWL
jgi:hypothetical protein